MCCRFWLLSKGSLLIVSDHVQDRSNGLQISSQELRPYDIFAFECTCLPVKFITTTKAASQVSWGGGRHFQHTESDISTIQLQLFAIKNSICKDVCLPIQQLWVVLHCMVTPAHHQVSETQSKLLYQHKINAKHKKVSPKINSCEWSKSDA